MAAIAALIVDRMADLAGEVRTMGLVHLYAVLSGRCCYVAAFAAG